MNIEVFTWKPSDWGENHGSFTKLYQSTAGRRTKTPFYTITFPAATGRGYNPYTPTM